MLLYNILTENNIPYIHQYPLKKLNNSYNRKYKFDAYLYEHTIAIELDGDQHFRPVCFGGMPEEEAIFNFNRQQKYDQEKNQFCIDNNIKLIRIDGRVYKGTLLKQYMLEIILPSIIK